MQLPIIYLHIPKTAGTSFRKSAEQYFGPEQVLNDYGEDSTNTSEDIRSAFYDSNDVSKLRQSGVQHKFLTGHFTLAKYREIFPESPVVTFFRNPVDRVVSEYIHFASHYNFKGDLQDFYKRPQFRNRQFNSMSGSAPEDIDFYGITEDYEKSLEMFNQRYGTNFPMVKLNVGKYKGTVDSVATEDELAEIKELNHKDIELYQSALERFNSQRARNPHSFKTAKRFCGSVGPVQQGKFVGWMVDRESTDPARVAVYINGKKRKQVIADLYREDVQRKGLHVNGNCGFALQLADLGRLAPGDRVSIRTIEGNFELTNSPFIVPG